MTLTLQGLRTVIHPVADLAAAKAWWTALLGTGPYFDELFYVGYDVAGYELGLLPDGHPEDGAQTYWGVADAQAAVDAAVALGAAVYAPASEVGEGIVTALVRSPQGSLVGFIVNPHFQQAS
jgi:predicted enzyme related to lactoylglutathione lyase